ncbi:MAG: electron transporter RnfC, partial [Nitrospinae bacterium]|nr:electron transporter RnfC [Nitrospinota bacterium]
MSGRGFAGGTHLDEAKDRTSAKHIEEMPLPPKVVIPLSQHFGAPAEPVVAVGDLVQKGQLIGKANGFISANIHASVSGKVTKIAP